MDDVKRPRIVLEVIEGNIYASADWAPGADLNIMGAVLSQLHQGKLVDFVANAVELAGDRLDDRENANGVNNIVRARLAQGNGGRGKPVVDPEHAIRLLMRNH